MKIVGLTPKARKEVEALRAAHVTVISNYHSRNKQLADLNGRRARLESKISQLEAIADPDDRKKIQQLAEAKVELDLVIKRISVFQNAEELPKAELSELLNQARKVLPRVLTPTLDHLRASLQKIIRPLCPSDEWASGVVNQLPGVIHARTAQLDAWLNNSITPSLSVAGQIVQRCDQILAGEIPGDYEPEPKKAAK